MQTTLYVGDITLLEIGSNSTSDSKHILSLEVNCLNKKYNILCQQDIHVTDTMGSTAQVDQR